MDESANSKRLILATGLCLVVMLIGQWMIPAKHPDRKVAQGTVGADAGTSSVSAALAGSNKVVDVQANGSAGDGDGVGKADAAATAPQIPEGFKPAYFDFEGKVPEEKGQKAVTFSARLTSLGGGIDSFILPTYRERSHNNQPSEDPLQLANSVEGLSPKEAVTQQMAAIRFLDGTTFKTPEIIPFSVEKKSESSVAYRYETPEGVTIEREYSFKKDSLEVELAVTIRNGSSKTQKHRLAISSALRSTEAMASGGGFFSSFIPPADHLDGLCYSDAKVKRESHRALEKELKPVRVEEGTRWVAADRQYFVSAMVLRDRSDASCLLEAVGPILRASLELPGVELTPGQEVRHKFTAYLGVKKPALLTLVDADLESAVDYRILGMNLAPICAGLLWILAFIHGLTGSWGAAILGLTVLVKLVLFPLNQRAGRSTRAMSQLKPAMDEIKRKFADDRQRQSEELMKLYRENGANPAGGCLPTLIQMPIWFALYRSLWSSVDLYQQPFLWLSDLTTPDPHWVLPILLILVMFLQQRMTPSTMDAAQQKMMQYTMPLVFGAMMIALPSGLCFYILVNTLLTIVQQHLINRSMGPIGGQGSVRGATA